MAMKTYRYTWSGVDLRSIDLVMPTTPVNIAATPLPASTMDLSVDETCKADLDVAMLDQGWAFSIEV